MNNERATLEEIKDLKHEPRGTIIDGRVQGLYYYWLDEDKLQESGTDQGGYPWVRRNTDIFSMSGKAIQDVIYVPYMDRYYLSLWKCDFDSEKFGYNPNDNRPQDVEFVRNPYVYRINKYTANRRTQFEKFKCYNTEGKNIGGQRNWRNESKLYQYPYTFALITDYMADPMEVIPHLCPSQDVYVRARTALSDRGTYSFFIEGYKGDEAGQTEGSINTRSMSLPNVSDAYSQFKATSSAQTATRNTIAAITAFGGMAAGGGIMGAGALIGGASQIADSIAKQSDLKSTPNVMTNQGSDLNFNLATSGGKGLGGSYKYGSLDMIRYRLTEEHMKQLGDYFALYGYKQNKIMPINFRNRHYYNYIKTIDIRLKGNGVPKQHLEKIKEIFNKGVTFWHMDREGVIFGDISNDNYEV